MERKYARLFALTCFLGGLVMGFLLAPIKKGVFCGNFNGTTYPPHEDLLAAFQEEE